MRVFADIRQRQLTGYKAVIATLAGAAMTVACAKLAFYLPGNPSPVTMQVFAVILCGMVLGSRLGAIAQLQYVMAGILGAPVFAPLTIPGPHALLGPTGGYLIGFVVAAYVIGLIVENIMGKGFAVCSVAGLFGVVIIHTFGVAWMSVWGGPAYHGFAAWTVASIPFIGADIAKVALAATIAGGKR